MDKLTLFTKMEKYVAENLKKVEIFSNIPRFSVRVKDSYHRGVIDVYLTVDRYESYIDEPSIRARTLIPERFYYSRKIVEGQQYAFGTNLPITRALLSELLQQTITYTPLSFLTPVDKELLAHPERISTLTYAEELRNKKINEVIEEGVMRDMDTAVYKFLQIKELHQLNQLQDHPKN